MVAAGLSSAYGKCIFSATIASKKTIYYRDISVSLSCRRPDRASESIFCRSRTSPTARRRKGARHVNRAFGDHVTWIPHIAYSADLLRLTRLNSIEPGYCTCAHMKYRPRHIFGGVFFENPSKRPTVECVLCAPLARNRVAAEAGQGERGTHQNVGGANSG